MKTTVQRLILPSNRRVFMTSDPHGHADGLKAVLKKANFSRDDVLFILGDLIEKGKQSLETLRLATKLQREYPDVYVLMGNVDLWRLEFLESRDPASHEAMKEYSLQAKEWWGGSFLHDLCAELGVDLDENTDIAALFPEIQRHFAAEIAYLRQLPTIIETQRMIFVHGGIPHERLDELAGTDAYPLLKFDDFYHAGLCFQKYVVAGHWPAVLYSKNVPDYNPLIDRQRRIMLLDGACGVKSEGQINLLSLPSWDSDNDSLYTWDGLPVIRALEDQEGSNPDEAVYLRWSDRWVELMEQGPEMSRVRYHGRFLQVPTCFLGEKDGKTYCRDTTDYVLPVKKQDELLLVLQLQCGCLVKKNGIAGWYFGTYEMKTEETL